MRLAHIFTFPPHCSKQHVDEDTIEARILARLAVLALSTNKVRRPFACQRLLRLEYAQCTNETQATHRSSHGVVHGRRRLDEALKHAQALVRDDVAMAAQALTELGESFLALNRLTLPSNCSMKPWNVFLLSRT